MLALEWATGPATEGRGVGGWKRPDNHDWCVGAAEDKLVYQLSADEGNRRRERDSSWRFEC